jgi:hypothetical protein
LCEPVTISTLGWVSLGLAAAGGAYSAYSARQQGRAEQAVAEENARRSELAASDEERRGRLEAAEHRMKVRRIFGQQKAAMASSGLELGTGSSFDVLADTLHFGEADAQNIEAESARQAWGLRIQGQDYRNQGLMARRAARTSSRSTLLTTGSSLVGSAYSMNEA